MDGLYETWNECGENREGVQGLSLGSFNGKRLGRRGETNKGGIKSEVTEEEAKLWHPGSQVKKIMCLKEQITV